MKNYRTAFMTYPAFIVGVMLWAIAGSTVSAQETANDIRLGPGITECGPLKKFWRGKPIIGRWMGQGSLEKAPRFYNKSSFPYVRRKYSTEVQMADFLTTPRLLGGWHPDKGGIGELAKHKNVADADLVYRKKDGSLAYRWHLLDYRLTRFVKAGYKDLTLVLDQIPYCFVKKSHLETYGQATPPDDMQEWYVFIRDLCKELRRRYGSKTANGFRFRLGTELGHGTRIAMTQEQLHEMYRLTHKAIKEVLPKAQLGPWNEAGFKDKQDRAPLSVEKLAKYAKEQGLAFDFASVSSYSIPKLRGKRINNGNPQQKAAGDAKFFQQLREIFPEISVEYHEFGILNSQYKVVTNEPGARGGAYRANYLLSALENKAIDRLYHWSVFDSIGKNKKHGDVKLLNSNGWLYSILEHAAGGELYVLEGSGEGNAICKAALITSRKKSYLIVSAFANDRREQGTVAMTLSVPSEIVKNGAPRRGAVRAVALMPQNEILQAVKKDLAKAGNLKPEFAKHPDLLAGVRSMAKNFGKARKMVMANCPAYQKQMESSLTLKPFGSKMNEEGKNLTLTFSMPTDSVMVFAW